MQMQKQLETTSLRTEIESKRLLKELEETKEIGESTLKEAGSKLNKFN